MHNPQANPTPHSPIRSVPELVWTPLITALIVLVPGVVAVGTGRILLFPSLGPSALMQAHSPEHPSSRFYNVVVSHLLGLGSAFLAVSLFSIAHEPSVFEVGSLSWERVAASVVAILIAATLELVLRASHPPAASTTLLASLGSFHPTPWDTAAVALGVLLVAVTGELFRRLRAEGVQPAP